MILRTEDLCFSYGAEPVLRDVSFSLDRGQVMCVMGPNGSGKSTLIDTIIGIHEPGSGDIYIDGQPIGRYSRAELAKKTAYVPQNHSVSFPYKVREIVLMGRTAYTSAFGTPGAEDREKCDEALEKTGLSSMADRPYSSLSGGELRLVLLARALCQDAPLILMDEPTAHLDYRNELRFLEIVTKLCADEHLAVLIATHSPEHAFYFDGAGVDTVALFLRNGGIYDIGDPDRVITEAALRDVYGVSAKIIRDESGKTIMLRRSL